MPGEEKVWLRDKSYRANRNRNGDDGGGGGGGADDDEQIKVTIHHYDYDPKRNNSQSTNDKGNYSNWSNDAGEKVEMLELTQTKLNNRNGCGETKNGHHMNNCSGPFINSTSTEPIETYENL